MNGTIHRLLMANLQHARRSYSSTSGSSTPGWKQPCLTRLDAIHIPTEGPFQPKLWIILSWAHARVWLLAPYALLGRWKPAPWQKGSCGYWRWVGWVGWLACRLHFEVLVNGTRRWAPLPKLPLLAKRSQIAPRHLGLERTWDRDHLACSGFWEESILQFSSGLWFAWLEKL